MKKENHFMNSVLEMLNKDKRTISLVVMFIIATVFMALLTPNFMTGANVRSMLLQMAEMGLFVLSMFIIMISGGLNLSIIAIANFSAAAMAVVVMNDAMPFALRTVLGLVAALATGMLCGLLNGIFVSKIGLQALLVTSASTLMFTGIAQLITKGQAIIISQPALVSFGNGALFNLIPYVFIIALVCFWAAAIFANNTKYGEVSRLLGANEQASKYCGNNNERTLLTAYIISGLFSAVGGIIVLLKTGIVRSEYGATLNQQALLTLLFAGLLLVGGSGKIINILISLATLQVISSGLNLAGVTNYMKNVLWGVMFMIVVVLNTPTTSEFLQKMKKKLIKEKPTKKVSETV